MTPKPEEWQTEEWLWWWNKGIEKIIDKRFFCAELVSASGR